MSLKSFFIKSVCDELSGLNGTEFESISKYIMELVTREVILQKGHNLCQKPVKSTVDLLQLNNVEIVGQCGTDSDYFKNGRKPEKDIQSSINNCPNCKTIYLFSNRRATGKQLTDIIKSLSSTFSTKSIIIYDSEKIANLMIDNIMCDTKIAQILAYLPQSYFYYNIYIHRFRMPILAKSYVHRSEEKDIKDKLSSNDLIQLYGLSGIGKTQLSLAVAQSLNDNFDSVLWLKGDEIDAGNIRSIHIESLSQQVNLEFLLSEFKILVIVDNLENNHTKFKDQFHLFNKKGSKCIISSKQKNYSPDCCFEVSFVPNDIAKDILLGSTIKPTDGQADTLIKRICGYPLLLVLSRNAVENGLYTWDELCNEETSLIQMPDENCAITFAQRIVEKYYTCNKELLNVISSFDSTKICKEFLQESNRVQYNNLISSAIINESDFSYVRIHSIVLQSIKNVMDDKGVISKIDTIILKYLKKHLLLRNVGLYSLMAAHGNYLLSLATALSLDSDLQHAIVLACIYTSDTSSDIDNYIGLMNQLTLSPNSKIIDLKLKIERIELEIYKLYDNKNEQNKLVKESICEHKSLLSQVVDSSCKALIHHHLGKWHKLVEEYNEAEAEFQESLNINPNAYNTRLQLARLYGKESVFSKAFGKVEEQLEIIMKDGKNEKVPLSILLSVYEMIATSKHDKLRERFLEKDLLFFEQTICASIVHNNCQVYCILNKLSKTLAYNHSDLYANICEMLPAPIGDSSNYFYDYANIMSALFEWCGRDENNYEVANKYYKLCKLDDDYKRKSLLHLYTIHKDRDEISPLISTFEDCDNLFNCQAFAKAYFVIGDFETALTYINLAIKNEEDCKSYYKAAFRHDKAQILKELNNRDCLQCIEEAIALQNNTKTINDWKSEKIRWEKDFQ